MTFMTVFVEVPDGYVGFIEELPGVEGQGQTLEEARENLRRAVLRTFDLNRDLAQSNLSLANRPYCKEPLQLATL